MRTRTDVRPLKRLALCCATCGWLSLCVGLSASRTFAQIVSAPPSNASRTETITADVIAARQKDATQSKDLDESTRSKALEFYHQAAEALTAAGGFAKQASDSKRLTAKAVQIAADTKAEQKRVRELVQLSEAAGRPKEPDGRTVGALESELLESRTALEPLLKQQIAYEKEPNRRANRRKEIRELLLAAQTDSRDLRKQLNVEAPKDEPGAITLARRTSLQARQQCVEEEVPALQAELGLYEAEDAVELVRLRRDLQTQRIALEQQRIKLLTQAVDKARRVEAERAVDGARNVQQNANPLLGKLADENMRLAEDLQKLTKPIEVAERELKESGDLWDKLREQFSKTRNKADGVGLTETIGQLLRKQRVALRDPGRFSARRRGQQPGHRRHAVQTL